MIYHIVLFKFKPEIAKEEISKLAEKLATLQENIPGITDFKWGESVSPEHKERGYTHGFIMTFENEQYRDQYLPHPVHAKIVSDYVDPICEEGLVFDIAGK